MFSRVKYLVQYYNIIIEPATRTAATPSPLYGLCKISAAEFPVAVAEVEELVPVWEPDAASPVAVVMLPLPAAEPVAAMVAFSRPAVIVTSK